MSRVHEISRSIIRVRGGLECASDDVHLVEVPHSATVRAARHDGAWKLPFIGEVAARVAVLVRPYGYITCAGDSRLPKLPRALTTWFGAAIPAR